MEKTLLTISILLGLTLLFFFAYYIFFVPSEETKVPYLIGLQTEDAQKILSSCHLKFKIENPGGDRIGKQRPSAGKIVKHGRTVTLTLVESEPIIEEQPATVETITSSEGEKKDGN